MGFTGRSSHSGCPENMVCFDGKCVMPVVDSDKWTETAVETAVGCMANCQKGGNSYKDCKDYCGADLQAETVTMVENASSIDYMTYGFAGIGLAFLMYGAFRHYSAKKDGYTPVEEI